MFIRFGIISAMLVGLLLVIGCDESDSSPAEPAIELIEISAVKLYAEREANATRYDKNYMGKWVRISGLVGKIDNGKVSLVTDEEAFSLLGTTFLDTIDLNDLPEEFQINTDVGSRVSATCKVGNYILGTINLDDCKP